jgi:C4-type Zn-finger protein
MQFSEPGHKTGSCPVCGKPVIVRSTRDKKPPYCSRVCESQRTHGTRYRGSMSGQADRPTPVDKTKWEG